MKYIVSLGLSVISFCAQAQYYERNQRGDSSHHQFVPKQITISLSPIIPDHGKYFFDGSRVRFEEVVLPLISVHDAVVDHRLSVVRTLTDLRRVVRYSTLGYFYFLRTVNVNSQAVYSQVLLTLVGIAVFTELYDFSILIAKRKAIQRYNDVILHPSFSVGQHGEPNLGFNIRF